jgi:hypothetical protein
MLDGGAPHGRHYYWKSHRLPEINDDVIDVMMECRVRDGSFLADERLGCGRRGHQG